MALNSQITPEGILRRKLTVNTIPLLLHAVLYYLYTNEIALCTQSAEFFPPPISAREAHGPISMVEHDIVLLAQKLELPTLLDRLHGFLMSSCTIRNITMRVLSAGSQFYGDDLRTYFLAYFRKHWKEANRTEEFREYSAGVRARNLDEYSDLLRFLRQFVIS